MIVALVTLLAVVAIITMQLSNKKNTDTSQSGASSPSAGPDRSTTHITSSTESTPSTTIGGPSSAAAHVVVDGTEQNVDGSVTCDGTLGVTINIGTTAIANLSTIDPPAVRVVTINTKDGVLTYLSGGGGDATATKNGKTYKISGLNFNGFSQGAAYGDDVQAALYDRRGAQLLLEGAARRWPVMASATAWRSWGWGVRRSASIGDARLRIC